jgi:hypothetical protein
VLALPPAPTSTIFSLSPSYYSLPVFPLVSSSVPFSPVNPFLQLEAISVSINLSLQFPF